MSTNRIYGGFQPVTGKNWRCRRYTVASGYDGPVNGIFPGDPVTLVTAGTLELATAGDADLIIGVVSHICAVINGVRQDVKYLPDVHTYSPTGPESANAPWVYVWDDPLCEYVVNVKASHADSDTQAEIYALVGANMDHAALANGDINYGRSSAGLDGNSIEATAQWRITEILRRPGNDTLTAAQTAFQVKCMINEGFMPALSAAGI